jgi:hypothetical protein
MVQKRILIESERKEHTMDLEKVDRLHQALSTELMTACTEESVTPSEALIVAMRLFSHVLAAYVAEADLPRAALRHEIEGHCRDASAMARARLLELCGYDLVDAYDEDVWPS